MEEEVSSYLERDVEDEDLFYLENGLTISNVRDLLIKVQDMDEETFNHYFDDEKNYFSTWIKDVYGDDLLASQLMVCEEKSDVVRSIKNRLLKLDKKNLEKFDIEESFEKLEEIETYITKRRQEGYSEEEIKDALTTKGFDQRVLDIIFVLSDDKLRELESLENLENMVRVKEFLEKLKKTTIQSIAQGVEIAEIKSMMNKKGIDEDIIDFILYDVFKPHPEIQKLTEFIKYALNEKNKSPQEIRKELTELGWEKHLVNFVVNCIQNPENKMIKALDYIDKKTAESKKNISKYLEELGWEEVQIQNAFAVQKKKSILTEIQEKLETDSLSRLLEKVDDQTFRFKDKDKAEKAARSLLSSASKISIEENLRKNSSYIEIGEKEFNIEHLPGLIEEDDFFSLNKLLKSKDMLFLSSDRNYLIARHKGRHYLILPNVKFRKCMACGKKFPVHKLSKVEFWDEDKIDKVTKYVCEDDKGVVKNLMIENKLVQS